MNKMKRLTGKKILLMAVVFCAFGLQSARNADSGEYANLNLRKSLGNCLG